MCMPSKAICFSAFLMSTEVVAQNNVSEATSWWVLLRRLETLGRGKALRSWQITDDGIPYWWKLWHSYGHRKQNVRPHPHSDSYQTSEEFPSVALVWPHMQVCLPVSFFIWMHCVSSPLFQVTLVASIWMVPSICVFILILKLWQRMFSGSVFIDKVESKNLKKIFSSSWSRILKTLVLPPPLKLEYSSTSFPAAPDKRL